MIYVSSSAIKSDSIEECIKKIASLGIRNIELSGGTRYFKGIDKILMKYKDEFLLNLLVHNYFPPPEEDFVLNIASYDEPVRKRSLALAEKGIKLAKKLGSSFYALHAGYAGILTASNQTGHFIIDKTRPVDKTGALSRMRESLSHLQAIADKLKMKIALENLFPNKKGENWSLLCTQSEIAAFLDDEETIILLDLGHLQISAKHFGFNKDEAVDMLAKKYHKKIVGIHISENDSEDDAHRLIDPDSWQLKAAARFDLSKIPVTIECRGIVADDIKRQYDMVVNKLEAGAYAA